MKTNISLIGMPASGKSTVGVVLAKTLNLDFVDTDIILQRTYGKTLCEIIATDGIDGFKQKESDIIKKLDCKRTCIATGGSAVYSKTAMEHLKEISTLIFLDVSYPIIKERILDIKTRGVVIENSKTLCDLYEERKTLYEEYADIVIDANCKTVEQIVSQVKKEIIKKGLFDF